MKKSNRFAAMRPNREAVARSLRELDALFGKQPPKENPTGQGLGSGETAGRPFKRHGGEL